MGLLALPVVILLAMAWSHRWVAEDAYINFRIIDQIEAGNGPVFNVGERVEAGTSPIWVVVVALAHNLVLRRVDFGWITVGLGLALTGLGLTATLLASRRLARRQGVGGRLLPFGALVIAVLPPLWDFTTSGLETALVLAWLGSCQYALVSRCTAISAPSVAKRRDAANPLWLPMLIGLGVLIRPDLAPFCVAFLVVLWMTSAAGRRGRLISIVVMVAAPLVYELFRAAYYASVVPNTALAKEASTANWGQGATYLWDLLTTYMLIIPILAAMLVIATWPWRNDNGGKHASIQVLVVAPMVGALAHATYVVRLGGDFMHGRFFVPAIFAFFMPLAVVAIDPAATGAAIRRVMIISVALWSAVSLVALRTPYTGRDALDGIVNERYYWMAESGSEHPITLDDYVLSERVRQGRDYARLAAAGENVLILDNGNRVPLAPGSGVVAVTHNIGLLSVAAGIDVRIVDFRGLGDPIAARMSPVPGARIGHQKALEDAWSVARFAPANADLGAAGVSESDVAAARRALACPPIKPLIDAVDGELSVSRAWQNITSSVRNATIRFPSNPQEAAQICSASR